MKSVLSILLILFAIGMHNAFASESTSLNEKLLQLGQTPAEHPVPFAPSLLKNEITADTHVELHGTPVFLPDGRCFFIEMQQKDSPPRSAPCCAATASAPSAASVPREPA